MRLQVPLGAPARVIADDCGERQSVSCRSLELGNVVGTAAIAHDRNGAAAVAGRYHAECHRNRVADDSEFTVPQPAVWNVMQSLPYPLAEFTAVDTENVVGSKYS